SVASAPARSRQGAALRTIRRSRRPKREEWRSRARRWRHVPRHNRPMSEPVPFATFATSATWGRKLRNRWVPHVAIQTRQVATQRRLKLRPWKLMLQPVAGGLRDRRSRKYSSFPAMSQMSQMSQSPNSFASDIATGQRDSRNWPRLWVQHEPIRITHRDDASPIFRSQYLDRGITTAFVAKLRRTEAKNVARLD